jgi:hypothetical protein|tara:strand:- start:206 stop:544 length:339 start_codon:yes stop_codon:yes gene_type:complete
MTNDDGDEFNRDQRGRFGKGNPGGGRPPGHHTPSLLAALRRRFQDSEGADGRSVADDIALEMVQRALNGDAKILTMLWDRLEGPVKQQVENDQVIRIERIDTRPKTTEDDDE